MCAPRATSAASGSSIKKEEVERADPDYYRRWRAQIKGAVDFLESSGIKVHRPEAMSDANMKFPRGENHGVLTGWLRDPFVTIGNSVIELAPRSLFSPSSTLRHPLHPGRHHGARRALLRPARQRRR